MKSVIKSEKDVRRFVKDNFLERAKFIEPSMGSTPGIPDCYLLLERGALLWVELKVGDISSDGVVTTKVRPAQRQQIQALKENGSEVAMLVGVLGTNKLVLTKDNAEMMTGVIQVPKKGGSRWSLVFIDGTWVQLPDLWRDLFFWDGNVPPLDWSKVNDLAAEVVGGLKGP